MRAKVLAVAALAVGVTILSYCVYQKKVTQSDSREVTMKEAIAIGEEEAAGWSEDYQLAQVISTDVRDEDQEEGEGQNGKRKSWNLLFDSREKDAQLNVYVIDGEAAYEQEVQMPVEKTIQTKDFMDSTEAARIAGKEGVLPVPREKGWAMGYHFVLRYAEEQDGASDTELVLMVNGQKDGDTAICVMDALNKNVIRILQRTGFDESGRSIWKEAAP